MDLIMLRRQCAASIMYFPRKWNCLKMQRRLKNKTPSIIANDCIGGIIYHDLGLKFNTPTINLSIKREDFFALVQNLEGYMNAELMEAPNALSLDYPVGALEFNQKKIFIQFVHYDSFEQAKLKWDERKKRIDFDNIYIIQNMMHATKGDIEAFDNLPYRNKMLISADNPTESKNVRVCSLYSEKDIQTRSILNYRSRFSSKRYLEEVNYVDFLNRLQ